MIHPLAAAADGWEERARRLGSLERLRGPDDVVILRIEPSGTGARESWKRVRDALAVAVDPVFLDPEGVPHYPTGRIAVRFVSRPSDAELEKFAAAHGLRFRGRNKYVGTQAVFEVAAPASAYLPEVLAAIGAAPNVALAWPETWTAYRRHDGTAPRAGST